MADQENQIQNQNGQSENDGPVVDFDFAGEPDAGGDMPIVNGPDIETNHNPGPAGDNCELDEDEEDEE
ncbi:hypothetical protein R5R35_001695 [Gryllus longicercus]|uniref:Uncharacterized protein n=1 Tax=Gryllus longicercus TaxID=2509291 RepID=A0AAN9V563_9ORTH